jgi:hypothetical protein
VDLLKVFKKKPLVAPSPPDLEAAPSDVIPEPGVLETALGALSVGNTGDMPIPVPSEDPRDWHVDPGQWPRRLPTRGEKAAMRKAGKAQRKARQKQRR